jgi:hypothetical protein
MGKLIRLKEMYIVCCLDIEKGGMSMVNIDSYIDSRRIKFVYRIINEPIESCNAIGKYRLSRFDLKFLQCVQKVETRTDILHVRLFGNCNITFQNKPLMISSF